MTAEPKQFFAHRVQVKGIDERRFIIDMVTGDIAWLGHVKLLLKSDNEPALRQFVRESLRAIRVDGVIEQISQECAVQYGAMTNGGVESAVRLVKGHIVVLKLALEKTLGRRIPVGHPLVLWLFGHAADLLTFRVKDRSSGIAAYEAVKGRTCSTRLLGPRGRPHTNGYFVCSMR